MGEPAIRLVLFDLGGVLIRIAAGHEDAAARAGVALPAFDPPQWSRYLALAGEYERGELDTDAYLAATAAMSGLPAERVRAVHRAWLIEPFPGVVGLVEDVKASGVATGCLSNTNAEHWAMMLETDGPASLPLHRLTHRFASQLIGHAKPGPGIYAHVERVTGVAPGSIVFFDDRADNVDAARSRGWRAHRVTDADDPASQVRGRLASYGVLP